jgi:predicted HNH restriction endonuclease
MEIGIDLIIAAYDISKRYYNKELKRSEGIEKLYSVGMNRGSAFIYMQVYQHLLNGEVFTRTLSAESFNYFLQQILSDFGENQLAIALDALERHIEYFESIKNYKMGLVREVYNKFVALAIRPVISGNIEDADEESFPEGKQLYKLHKFKERNRELIKLAKANYKKSKPSMNCQVCNFSFADKYGSIGGGFIEAHHTFPISLLKIETPTRLEDIVFVCANCHRMLHRKRPWITMHDLQNLLLK